MHIVHLETGRHLYGGGQQVLILLDGLRHQGIESTLVCAPESELATAAGGAGVNVHTLPMGGDLDPLFTRRFARWLRDHRPDLLHVHSRRGADVWGGRAAKQLRIPAVLSRRVDNRDMPVVGRLKYHLYQRVIGISEGIIKVLRATGVPNDKLRLVRSAIDVERCQPGWSKEQFRSAFGLAANELAVVCVAQLITRKGHADLLRAWQIVAAQHPHARLIIFGRGPLDSALRAQADRLGLAGSVRFAGFRQDLRGFLGHADLLVHPAYREGLGIALLEAQAAGVPVVAGRAGGIPEAVADGHSGVLVTPGDVREIARAIALLLSDSERRQRMGAAGRALVTEHFSPKSMVSGNLAVYRELLQ